MRNYEQSHFPFLNGFLIYLIYFYFFFIFNVFKYLTCHTFFNILTYFNKAPVYLYYGLKNFYQNHRRYVKSRDDSQLLGNSIVSQSSLNTECAPYDSNGTYIYAPCGAIANSLFNGIFYCILISFILFTNVHEIDDSV